MANRTSGDCCVVGTKGYNAGGEGVGWRTGGGQGVDIRKKVLLLLALSPFILLSFMAGCALYDPTAFLKGAAAKAIMVESSADQVTLQWDPPASEVARYLVSFRIHGDAGWVSLGEVPAAPTPEYTVQHAVLGDGDFDFAVIAENSVGEQSAVHMSGDQTAQPSSGWFLRWRK